MAYKSQEKSQSTNSKYFLTFFEMFMDNVMIIWSSQNYSLMLSILNTKRGSAVYVVV